VPTPISVIVAQRTAMAGQLLCRALKEQRKHLVVVGCTETPNEFLKQVAEHEPDVAVVSSSLDNDPQGGIKILRELRVCSPTTRPILLLDSSDAEHVIDAFSAGAKGVACQTDPFELLCKCIRCVYAGQIWANSRQLQWIVKALGDREPVRVVSAKGVALLTPREEQVVGMVVEGLPNQEISVKLGVSSHTVKNHLFRIYEKLGISSRMELVLYASGSRERSRRSGTRPQGDF
jgi:DNA-binding NarL/FixJ family response regulator